MLTTWSISCALSVLPLLDLLLRCLITALEGWSNNIHLLTLLLSQNMSSLLQLQLVTLLFPLLRRMPAVSLRADYLLASGMLGVLRTK